MVCYVTTEEKSGYRPCVGIVLINQEGGVFVGQRTDSRQPGWQMPQGGIDPGETPLQAAWREMLEEIGTDNATLLAESQYWRSYDLPVEIAGRIWQGRYVGQTQRWFAFGYAGDDAEIVLDAHEQEFSHWCWLPGHQLVDRVVPFKKDVYASVADEFRHLWA